MSELNAVVGCKSIQSVYVPAPARAETGTFTVPFGAASGTV